MRKKYQRKREQEDLKETTTDSVQIQDNPNAEEVKNKTYKNKSDRKVTSKNNKSKNTTKGKTKKKRKLDPLSWFFIVVSLAIVGLLVYITIQLTDKTFETTMGYDYYNEDLNFSLRIPEDWRTVGVEEDLVERVVDEATGGLIFDMRLFTLKEEIVPVTLIQPTEENEDKPFKKFMTMGFIGSDQLYSPLNEHDKLKEDFKDMLTSLGHTDVKISNLEEVANESMLGVLMEGSAKLDGSKVTYYQYLEPAGANILKVTYGNALGEKSQAQLEDITQVTDSLMYHEGGIQPIEPPQAGDYEPVTDEEDEEEDGDTSKEGINVNLDEDQSTEGIEIEEIE